MNNTRLLSRPIAYHRVYAELTGSVTAAVLLSQAVYWQKKNDHKDWFKTQIGWEDETGLTRRQQETARKKLRQFSWWNEESKGLPAKIYYKVDLFGLLKAIDDLN